MRSAWARRSVAAPLVFVVGVAITRRLLLSARVPVILVPQPHLRRDRSVGAACPCRGLVRGSNRTPNRSGRRQLGAQGRVSESVGSGGPRGRSARCEYLVDALAVHVDYLELPAPPPDAIGGLRNSASRPAGRARSVYRTLRRCHPRAILSISAAQGRSSGSDRRTTTIHPRVAWLKRSSGVPASCPVMASRMSCSVTSPSREPYSSTTNAILVRPCR